MKVRYRIMFRALGRRTEEVDSCKTRKEAERMLEEYRQAFRFALESGCLLWLELSGGEVVSL